MKKTHAAALSLLIALILSISLTAYGESAAYGDKDAFVTTLEETNYVQSGTLQYLDTIEMASKGMLISCFGNNAGSGYLCPILPPAPAQDPAPATTMGKFSWPAEAPSKYYDAAGENAPANPYFSPVGWTYKLRQDEAVVIMGELPPECMYFSFINYIFASPVKSGKEYTERSFFKYGSAESGVYHPIFGSLGEPLNHNTIKHGGDGASFGNKYVYIVSGNKTTMAQVKEALIESGFSEKLINEALLPSAALNMGLDKTADVFNVLLRVSQPKDNGKYEQWIAGLSESAAVYRVTPKSDVTPDAYQNPVLKVRGTGENEISTLPDANRTLDQIRANLIAQYGAEYTYEELSSRIAVPEGMTGYQNDENAQGDNRDTTYLMTNDFVFDSDEDFVVVYGVNHVKTGKATYANTVLYARPMLNGIVSLYDSIYSGSAAAYTGGAEDSDMYYVIKMARKQLDAYTAQVQYSTGNQNGFFYGADNGAQLFLAYRAYIEPATGVGPSYYEIIYDRAIVFHKK